MKVGDCVKLRAGNVFLRGTQGSKVKITSDAAAEYGYGIIIDVQEDDMGFVYYKVSWSNSTQEWWAPNEMELISEAKAR